MRDSITDLLDAVGLVAIAIGLGGVASRWIGWFGIAVAGATIIAGSALAHRTYRPEADR